jgi:hypothetical protein
MSWGSRWKTNFAFSYFQKVTMLCYFLMLIPVWGPGVVYYFIASPTSKSMISLIFGSVVVSVAGSWWYSRITAHYMVVEGLFFKGAAKHTFFPVLAKLTFLPLAGAFFRRFIEPEEPAAEIDAKDHRPPG